MVRAVFLGSVIFITGLIHDECCMVFLRLKKGVMRRFRLAPDPLSLSSSPYGSLHLTIKPGSDC